MPAGFDGAVFSFVAISPFSLSYSFVFMHLSFMKGFFMCNYDDNALLLPLRRAKLKSMFRVFLSLGYGLFYVCAMALFCVAGVWLFMNLFTPDF